MHCLKTRMVVHEHQQVLVTGVIGSYERAGDVGVDETAGVRRLIEGGVVSMTGSIGRSARRTSVETPVREGWRRIGGNRGQRAQARGSSVDSVVHPFGGLGRRHDADVMVGTRSVNGVASWYV
eukprot:1761259-Pleurochrysis_carterae.AAC.1